MKDLMQVDASITKKKCAIAAYYSKVLWVKLFPDLLCFE